MNNGDYTGRLTKDFALSSSGKMGMGTVAVDRPYPFNKDKDGNKITDFLTIKILGEDKAQRAETYLKKGVKIAFTGITCRDTSKNEDGTWNEYNYILVTNWEFAESKSSGSDTQEQTSSDGFMAFPDDSELESIFG